MRKASSDSRRERWRTGKTGIGRWREGQREVETKTGRQTKGVKDREGHRQVEERNEGPKQRDEEGEKRR